MLYSINTWIFEILIKRLYQHNQKPLLKNCNSHGGIWVFIKRNLCTYEFLYWSNSTGACYKCFLMILYKTTRPRGQRCVLDFVCFDMVHWMQWRRCISGSGLVLLIFKKRKNKFLSVWDHAVTFFSFLFDSYSSHTYYF